MERKGALTRNAIDDALDKAEVEAEGAKNQNSLNDAHLEAIRFPVRFLKMALSRGSPSFEATTAAVGHSKDENDGDLGSIQGPSWIVPAPGMDSRRPRTVVPVHRQQSSNVTPRTRATSPQTRVIIGTRIDAFRFPTCDGARIDQVGGRGRSSDRISIQRSVGLEIRTTRQNVRS